MEASGLSETLDAGGDENCHREESEGLEALESGSEYDKNSGVNKEEFFDTLEKQ